MRDSIKNNHKKTQRGTILIMTLIIIGGLTVVAVEFSLFTISSIRQARAIDNSMRAYYAAESGTESALHQLRKEEVKSAPLKREMAEDADMSWYLDAAHNGVFADHIPQAEYALVKKNQSVELNMYEQDGAQKPVSGIESVKVEWKDHVCEPGYAEPWIEVASTAWPNGGTDLSQVSAKMEFQIFKESQGKNVIVNALENKPQAVRIKSYYCDLRGVVVSFYSQDNATGTKIDIPNFFLIKPLSSYQNVQQKTQVLMPKKSPVSGIYDYVLFSEEAVSKD